MGATGCETPPLRVPAAHQPARPNPSLQPLPTKAVATAQDSVPPTAAQSGYHCYRGTLDGRPVQLDLTVAATTVPYGNAVGSADVNGLFRFLDTGEPLDIGTPYGIPASRPLQIERWTDRMHSAREAVLCTDQPVGPVLTGTYALGRRIVPFRVQEDYSDCLRYEVLDESTDGRLAVYDGDTTWASVRREYIHLLGPDTLRPAWARMQCPPPAQRERDRRTVVRKLDASERNNQYLWLRLNEAGLLAYDLEERTEYYRSRNYDATARTVLYDLHTGRELKLPDQLRPGGWRRLHQLLHRQAMADTAFVSHRDYWRGAGMMPLPGSGFAVTPEGLVASYHFRESELDRYGYGQTLSWAALRPLLRPGSPLHRLVRAQARYPH